MLVTLVERRSKFARIGWNPDGRAEAVTLSVLVRLECIRCFVQTLACDRGNENFNGLLRQFLPRNRGSSTITAQELQRIEDQLNDRPRTRLGYLTPAEVLFNHDHIAFQS